MKSNGKLGKLDATSRGESAKDNSLTQKSCLMVRPDVKKMGGCGGESPLSFSSRFLNCMTLESK